jgi:hypothetical protein
MILNAITNSYTLYVNYEIILKISSLLVPVTQVILNREGIIERKLPVNFNPQSAQLWLRSMNEVWLSIRTLGWFLFHELVTYQTPAHLLAKFYFPEA